MSYLRTVLLPVVMLLFILFPVSGDPVDDLLNTVDLAVEDDRNTQALSLLEEGKRDWPKDPRISIRAGDLYFDQELYRLALGEYKRAIDLDPGNLETHYDVATTYGYLGENDEAVLVLEEVLFSVGEDDLRDRIIDDLSWMYFKTYRMQDGIRLLESELETEFDRSWAHTLGTLYSGIYDYDQSRRWYMKSIDDALDSGDEYFASVAFYNLSLLDFSFYRYSDARRHAKRSLELRDRAGGHMITGELDFLAWDLDEALAAYRDAESLDTTPLARLDIAEFYRRTGHLDQALHFISAISDGDEAWMYHFGIDQLRFGMDISEILADSWRGKAKIERLTPRWGRGSRFLRFVRFCSWSIRGAYHDIRFKALAMRYSRDLAAEGNELDTEWNAYRATEDYRISALRHLEKARRLETALVEEAAPWYLLEGGILRKDSELLSAAIEGFQTEERDPYERALRAVIEVVPKADRQRPAAEAALYSLNPGGFRQYGMALPMSVAVVAEEGGQLRRRIIRVLRSAGYRVVKPGSGDLAALTVSERSDGYTWFISDPDGRSVSEGRTPLIRRKAEIAEVLDGMLDRFYLTVVE